MEFNGDNVYHLIDSTGKRKQDRRSRMPNKHHHSRFRINKSWIVLSVDRRFCRIGKTACPVGSTHLPQSNLPLSWTVSARRPFQFGKTENTHAHCSSSISHPKPSQYLPLDDRVWKLIAKPKTSTIEGMNRFFGTHCNDSRFATKWSYWIDWSDQS